MRSVILVDDGSTDGTLQQLIRCNEKDRRFKVLALSRNFGHQAAYTAGLTYAKGEYIAMMDGDLQDPPELLLQMYEKLTTGNADIVYGKRTQRNEKASKRLSIKIFHSIFTRLSNLKNIDQVGNFFNNVAKGINCIPFTTGKESVSARTTGFYWLSAGLRHIFAARPRTGRCENGLQKAVGACIRCDFFLL